MEQFQFSIATAENRREVRDFLMQHFLVEETMNAATKITEPEFFPFAERILDSAFQTPFSVICRQENGNIVGIALNSVRRRDDIVVKNPSVEPERRPEIDTIVSICEGIHSNVWELLDTKINTVLELDILSVASSFQRRGIASEMLDKRKSMELLQRYHIQGFICQASSHANQILLKNRGYQELKDVPFTRYVDDNGIPLIEPLDETRSVKLFWLPYDP